MYFIVSFIAKLSHMFFKTLRLGSGNTWPGHLSLMLYPGLLENLYRYVPEKVVLITGTNGKTTTSKIVTHLLENSGFSVLHNESGANLLNGIVSSILLEKNPSEKDIGVFEVDEFTLPTILKYINPSIVVLLNLSRDQLDRHWETDIVLDKWQEALAMLKKQPILILDSTQKDFNSLSTEYTFDANTDALKQTKMLGEFNAKNVNCALKVVEQFGVSRKNALDILKDFDYAYGRGEKVVYKSKDFRVLLAKNPASVNQNLKLLGDNSSLYDTLVYVLNDNVPDGHDVSWIYDVDPDLLKKASMSKNIYVTGVRAYDMAVRLMYAGVQIKENHVNASLSQVLNTAASDNDNKSIVVLPNYSAMLETRKILVGRSIL